MHYLYAYICMYANSVNMTTFQAFVYRYIRSIDRYRYIRWSIFIQDDSPDYSLLHTYFVHTTNVINVQGEYVCVTFNENCKTILINVLINVPKAINSHW